MVLHAHDFNFSRSERLDYVTKVFSRQIEIKILNRLDQIAVCVALENDLWTGNHNLESFATHLFDENGDLHLAARLNLERTGGFGIGHLERYVATRLANQPFAQMPC